MNEGTLVLTDNIGENGLNSIGNGLGYDLKNNIAKGNGSVITGGFWVIYFRDETYIGGIVLTRIPSLIEDL
jgi:hypothetical protein